MDFANFIFSNAFILLFLPIWVAFLLTLNFNVPGFRSKKFTTNLTLISTGICTIYSMALLYLTSTKGIVINEEVFDWLRINDVTISFGFALDNLSALFLLIFLFISFFIQLYSYEYMKNDESFHRYFIYLNLYNFTVSGLFVSTNLIQTYIFIGLVSGCSYLLTGFWFKKKSVSEKAKMSFLISKFSDCFLFLGIILIVYFAFSYFPGFNFSSIKFSYLYELSQNIVPYSAEEGLLIIGFVLVLGIFVKSLQFPFYIKSIDTEDSPVSVLALINSTVVGSVGIYLFMRFLPLFNISHFIMELILYIGLFTSLICVFLALFQNNIKKIFSYIVYSQLGLIYALIGLNSSSCALLHFTLIVFPIALLFLLSGIIIYMEEVDDIKYMGGLRKVHPYLAISYLIGSLSLSGVFLNCIYSKMEIITLFLDKTPIVILTEFLTTFCCLKTYFLIFEGENKLIIKDINLNFSVKFSIIILTILSLTLGLIIHKNFYLLFDIINKDQVSIKIFYLSVILDIIAIAIVYILFKRNKLSKIVPQKIRKVVERDYFSDTIYDSFLKFFYIPICKIFDFSDKLVGITEKTLSIIIKMFSIIISKLQTGSIQSYLLGSLLGIIAALGLIVFYYFKIQGF